MTFEDDDGCPEVALQLGAACRVDARDEKTLASIADEIRPKVRLTKLRVVSGTARCAAAVRSALEHRGVAADRLETKIESGRATDILFEVAAWDGTSCKP